MSDGKYLRRMRERWFPHCPNCHWCGVAMTPVVAAQRGVPLPPTMVTVDHLYSRLNPMRVGHLRGAQRHVLACLKCNNERSKAEQAALPIEELHERSKRHPSALRRSASA